MAFFCSKQGFGRQLTSKTHALIEFQGARALPLPSDYGKPPTSYPNSLRDKLASKTSLRGLAPPRVFLPRGDPYDHLQYTTWATQLAGATRHGGLQPNDKAHHVEIGRGAFRYKTCTPKYFGSSSLNIATFQN